MMRNATWGVVCTAVLLSVGTVHADKKKAAPTKEEQAQMAEAMAKYSTPGEQHKKLQPLVGSWVATGKFSMGPGNTVETTGSAEIKSILGGRFVEENYTGTFMGHPFSGLGLTGYDLNKQKYVGMWTDTMITWMLVTEGSMDPAGKVLTMTANEFDPQSGSHIPVRFVTKIESDKKHIVEFYMTRDGKEIKTGEIVYTKK